MEEHRWLARPYKYADGVPWNEDRYEVFVLGDAGTLVSVGGAIRSWDMRTVAFLCGRTMQRVIRTQQDAVTRTNGLYVIGASVIEALNLLKIRWPRPAQILDDLALVQQAEFERSEFERSAQKKPPQPINIVPRRKRKK